jgi:hypothetical protein
MSTTTFDSYSESGADGVVPYRAIHPGAIIGLMLGVFSVVMLIVANVWPEGCLPIAFIPAAGMSVSLWSWSRIKRDSEQLTGATLALIGFLLSTGFLISGGAYASYVYVSEVPNGYDRISFETLKPDQLQEVAGVAIPPEVQAMAGKHVFIKGYIRPGSAPVRTGIDRFLLVRDNNQCCFGDLSKVKYYDQMAVQITSTQRIEDTLQVLRMGGTLEIHPENLARGVPIFMLKADYAVQ